MDRFCLQFKISLVYGVGGNGGNVEDLDEKGLNLGKFHGRNFHSELRL